MDFKKLRNELAADITCGLCNIGFNNPLNIYTTSKDIPVLPIFSKDNCSLCYINPNRLQVEPKPVEAKKDYIKKI